MGPKVPWKVRPAAIGSEVLRIVKLQFHANCNNLIRFCGAEATTPTRQPREVRSLQAERASKIEL